MSSHSVGLFQHFGAARRHVAALKLAGALVACVHCSAAQKKYTAGTDVAQEISNNIVAAGIRYLKGDKEKLAENLRARKAGVDVENMVCVVFVFIDPLPYPSSALCGRS